VKKMDSDSPKSSLDNFGSVEKCSEMHQIKFFETLEKVV
jgi:hypothetical protein